MNGRILVLLLAASLLSGGTSPVRGAADHAELANTAVTRPAPPVDLTTRKLAEISPGTVIGKGAPKGWSHLVMISKPRLGVGDLDSVSETAGKSSGVFLFTVLANVKPESTAGRSGESRDGDDDEPSYYLEKLAVGGALEGDGKTIVAKSDQTFGHDLGFLGRKVFANGEKVLATDFRQVARTRTMMVFDAHAYVRYKDKHSRMVIRHVVLVEPKTGRLSTFVWLLGADGKGGYALAETTLQLLPEAMREDRVMSVDGDKFTFGIPSEGAFALARIPQGTPVRYSSNLSSLAIARRFDAESLVQLETELRTRYAPLADRDDSNSSTTR